MREILQGGARYLIPRPCKFSISKNILTQRNDLYKKRSRHQHLKFKKFKKIV